MQSGDRCGTDGIHNTSAASRSARAATPRPCRRCSATTGRSRVFAPNRGPDGPPQGVNLVGRCESHEGGEVRVSDDGCGCRGDDQCRVSAEVVEDHELSAGRPLIQNVRQTAAGRRLLAKPGRRAERTRTGCLLLPPKEPGFPTGTIRRDFLSKEIRRISGTPRRFPSREARRRTTTVCPSGAAKNVPFDRRLTLAGRSSNHWSFGHPLRSPLSPGCLAAAK